MASKLMGLRDDLDQLIETEAAKVLTANQFLPLPGFDGIVDAIISAAHSEGVAEGAEQERERIHSLARHPTDENCHGYVYVVPVGAFAPPVLAPTKEGEK